MGRRGAGKGAGGTQSDERHERKVLGKEGGMWGWNRSKAEKVEIVVA